MRAGLLDKKVNFIRYTFTPNAYGDRKKTSQIYAGDVWCNIKFVGSPSEGASEEVDNNQVTGKIKIEILCRFFSGVAFDDAVVYQGATYDIYSIQEVGRKEGLRIRAQLRDDLERVTF